MTEKQTQINREFWLKLWSLLKPFKVKIKKLALIIALVQVMILISPYLLKLIVDRIANFDPERIRELLGLVVIMFITEAVTTLIHYFKDKKIFDFLIDIEYHLPILLQKKLVSLPLGYHEKENTGNKIIKVQRGVDKLVDLMINACWEFWPTITQITFTFALMCYFNISISLIFIFFVPIFIYITYRMNQVTNPLRHSRHSQYEQASGMLGQSIINIYTVQSFVQEAKEAKKYKKTRDNINQIQQKEFGFILNYNMLRGFTIDIGRVCIVLFSVYMAWRGAISVGSLVFFITLSETAYHALFRLSRTYDRLIESSTGVQRITRLLDEKSDIKNKPKIKNIKKLNGKVEFKNVYFSYNPKNKIKTLKNLNFLINPGETVALVGPSGGGKSTIVKLLYRHYDVTSGEIIIDDKNIRDYDIYEYRSNLAIVPQDVEIFNTSIRENIAYGRKKVNIDEIKKAAKIANIDFVEKMENKFDTMVGERGVKLSGGQKQRVGIARAVLSKPSILIFDEATSNLDTHSERMIQKAIENISKNQTMIIIAHRLSTIINADKIMVINKGQVEEGGTHEQLMNKDDGIYAELLKLQALGEIK